VATITNTSTASTGVYNITVGEEIKEKIGSKSYDTTLGIGGGVKKTDANGNYLDSAGKIIGTADFGDANILAYVASKTGETSVTLSGTDYIGTDGVTVVATTDGTTITKASDGADIAGLNADGVLARHTSGTDHNTVIGTADQNAAGTYYPPLTITMGGKTLSIAYDAAGSLEKEDPPGSGTFVLDPGKIDSSTVVYHKDMTMEQLATVINNAVAADPTNSPNIKADLVYDKTRGTQTTFSRLTITGGEGGVKNHITISDPTGLSLDKNSIDAPVTSGIWTSNASPSVTADSQYTGLVNKTFTIVATNYTDKTNGILGTDAVQFSWADTEGNKGTFIVRATDWDQQNDCLKEPVELIQGVKITLAGGPGENRIIKNSAFTIDCQAPVMQKAADTGISQTDKWVHQGVSDLITPVSNGGKFVYSYAGREYTVNINGEVSLSALVERINTDAKNPGVIASVLNDGMGTSTSYKLVLSGNKSGAEYGIRILDSTSLTNMPTDPSTWDHAREASNSMCRIDGYPNDGDTWIQRTGNEVGDVIDGVVVTLQGPGETQITVQNNVTEMVNKIKQLIESVNFCKSYIKEQTKYGGGKLVSKVLKDGTFQRTTEGGEASGVMIGNYGFQISQSNIDRLMTKEIFTRDEYIKALNPDGKSKFYNDMPDTVEDEERDGPSKQGLYQDYLDKHGLIYTRLSDIGIASNPENAGQYIVENSKLTEALTKNPEAVMKLFTFTPPTSEGQSLDPVYADEPARPRIAGFSVTLGYAMSDLTRTTDVIDSKTGQVVKPAKGITKVLAQNYNEIISGPTGKEGIDAKIAREEKRVAMVRERLEQKFARLETLLATLNNKQSSIESQLAKLNGD
jgi:flagellar hook-associated protein 2